MTLQTEIKRSRPFEVPEEEAALNLSRTHQAIAEAFERLFRQHDITATQYNVLRILNGAGSKGLPILEVGARMVTRVPDITRLVDRLEAAGLVERRRCESDRRMIYVKLDPAARRLLERLASPVVDLHRRLLGHLTRKELAELNRLLEKARAGCERIGPEHSIKTPT